MSNQVPRLTPVAVRTTIANSKRMPAYEDVEPVAGVNDAFFRSDMDFVTRRFGFTNMSCESKQCTRLFRCIDRSTHRELGLVRLDGTKKMVVELKDKPCSCEPIPLLVAHCAPSAHVPKPAPPLRIAYTTVGTSSDTLQGAHGWPMLSPGSTVILKLSTSCFPTRIIVKNAGAAFLRILAGSVKQCEKKDDAGLRCLVPVSQLMSSRKGVADKVRVFRPFSKFVQTEKTDALLLEASAFYGEASGLPMKIAFVQVYGLVE